MKETSAIVLQEVSKTYNGKDVLINCSHVFEQGKLHALIGPNGSGKTTLLRICSLIEAVDAGEVLYKNKSVYTTDNIGFRRKVTMVFSKGGLFNTTVFDNAAYGLKIRGVGTRRRAELVEEVLLAVGLWDMRKQNALTLSSGEGQRLAIARAVVFDPEIILLDEPTASLDPANTINIEELISSLIKKQDRTIIMATHNMFQAQRLSDKVVFMHEGHLYDEGETKDFFENPVHDMAYKFITGKLIY